jgi:6-phosphofructokinase 1
MHSGAPSPGMNAAVRAIVRLGLYAGYTVLAVQNGFAGLAKGQLQDMQWLSVNGWALKGGSELGTNRAIPTPQNIANIARVIEVNQINVLIMFGGYTGYQGSIELNKYKEKYAPYPSPPSPSKA